MDKTYVVQNQILIEKWQNKFDVLFGWNIKFACDNEHWCHTIYDIKNKIAKIFPCDIDEEESYIIHETVKLAFIAAENNMENKLSLIKDIVSIITMDDSYGS